MHSTAYTPTDFIGQKLRPQDKGRECIGKVLEVFYCENLEDTAFKVEWPGGKIESVPCEPSIEEHGYVWVA